MTPYVRSQILLEDLGRLHPKLIDLSLDRIIGLLSGLGNPHEKLAPVIHVAGTNGKGSTVAFLRAVLEAGGKRVHTYTSPHLVRFHERIRVARAAGHSTNITEDELIEALEHVIAVNAGNAMTFFEMTTAAAFLVFSQKPADVVLLEVGLGGRLDATNVVRKPELSIITPVSLDHVELLAPTVEEIALEKAGILKPGVPAVVGPQPDEAVSALETVADRVGAPLQWWGQDFDAYEQSGRLVFQKHDRLIDCRLPDLAGRFQIVNAGVAIAALLNLEGDLSVSESDINKGLGQVQWPARMMRLAGGPLAQLAGEATELWLDGGHNAAAGQVLAQFVADLEDRAPKPTYLITGMMRNKDVESYIGPFRDLVREVVTVPIKGHESGALSALELAERVAETDIPVSACTSVLDAMRQILSEEPDAKRILICGSLYLAGNVLAFEESEIV